MLDDKEFVPKIANWSQGREVQPGEEGVRFDSWFISLELGQSRGQNNLPVGGQVSVFHSSCNKPS